VAGDRTDQTGRYGTRKYPETGKVQRRYTMQEEKLPVIGLGLLCLILFNLAIGVWVYSWLPPFR
jgi:hypothetical protein